MGAACLVGGAGALAAWLLYSSLSPVDSAARGGERAADARHERASRPAASGGAVGAARREDRPLASAVIVPPSRTRGNVPETSDRAAAESPTPASISIQSDGTSPSLVGLDAAPDHEEPPLVLEPSATTTPPQSATSVQPSPQAGSGDASGANAWEIAVIELASKQKLLFKNTYPALRAVYAKQFEASHEALIRQAYGPDYDQVTHWLDRHVELKEEFYTAIDEDRDNVRAALEVFRDLFNRFPDRIGPFGNLAIAIAVVWDQPGQAVYDYAKLQRLTKSQLPSGCMDALDNFDYYSSSPREVSESVQSLPWEFLVHLVNHRTPKSERVWSVRNYVAKRTMYGKCYHDVPYDYQMLNSHSQAARLNGHDYTLESLRRYGGVCAIQADFASRVGKCLAVPAEYVSGESRFNDSHAWVIWAEIRTATKDGVTFSLQSCGRYRDDNYYVGTLVDPHTGARITDRQLELRLHGVGMSPAAYRQVRLVMKAFPALRDEKKMPVAEQLNFLYQAIKLSPWSEEPWRALASMSREGRVNRGNARQMMVALEKLYATFASVPDFTWTVFDDLASFQTDPNQRAKLYERLIAMYEQGGRPDLACEASLKLSQYETTDGKCKEAVEGLASTIKKFPDEGRYVPKLLDALEEICAKNRFPHCDEHLARFYQDLLPMIPQTRGGKPSKFCMKMYERAIDRFKALGRTDLAKHYAGLLAELKGAAG